MPFIEELKQGSMELDYPQLPEIVPPLVASNEAAVQIAANQRRRFNPALFQGATEPLGPLTLRASAALECRVSEGSGAGDVESLNAEDTSDATVIPAEWRRIVVELRGLSEKAERSLTEFQKAIDQPNRLGIGGNNPPEAIREDVVQAIFAAKVVRLQAEEPSRPILDLALSVLKRAAQAISNWLADKLDKVTTAVVVYAAIEAVKHIGTIIEMLERLKN